MTVDHATRIVMSHRLLRRYVLPGERVVLATRRHWAKLIEPGLTASAVFCVCGWLIYVLQPALGDGVLVVGWLWAAALARFAWYLLLWRVEWFVATDKRMLLLTGLVTHQIGMMPLMKVTDMRYSRSVLGQLLGYGQFLLESAGQDQALRQINWVARPDATYRDLCALIFTPVGERDWGDGPVGPPRRPPAPRPDEPPPSVPPPRAPSRPGGGALAVSDAPVATGAATGGASSTGRPGGREDRRPDQRPGRGAPDRWAEPVVVWPSRDRPFEHDDTQPLRLRPHDETDDVDAAPHGDTGGERRLPPTLAESTDDGTSVEAEAIAGEEALRLDEEDAHERAWDVSEPTTWFVDLGRRQWGDDDAAPGSPTAPRPEGGNEDEDEGHRT